LHSSARKAAQKSGFGLRTDVVGEAASDGVARDRGLMRVKIFRERGANFRAFEIDDVGPERAFRAAQ
jgi:hypothetical protein